MLWTLLSFGKEEIYPHTSVTDTCLVVWRVRNMEECDRFFFFDQGVTFGSMASRQAVFPSLYGLCGILADLLNGNYVVS